MLNSDIFRRYDIRGVVGRDLTHDVVARIGRGLGELAWRRGAKSFAVGRDCRSHSVEMRDALIEGLKAAGLTIFDVGLVPTPLLYFAVHHEGFDGGVQITGSHNPPEYNGFKMMIGLETLHDASIDAIKDLAGANLEPRDGGSVATHDVLTPYLDHVAEDIDLKRGRPLKVVIDAGNGVGGVAAVPLLQRLGVELVELYTEPDGTFPNHHPDPSEPENLRDLVEAVRAHGADVGIAYDGDGDRVGVVDERGAVVFGDHLTAYLARGVLEAVPGATIIGEVKCSKTMYDDIRAHGGVPIMWKVGHSLIKAHMQKTGAMLAGEMSGHIFFKHRFFGFDDAIYTTARLLERLIAAPEPLSVQLADIETLYGTPEIRVEVPDRDKFDVADALRDTLAAEGHEVITLDGVRVHFRDGWGLVRASNTQPALVLRAEGSTPERRDEILSQLYQWIAAARAKVGAA